MRQIVPSYFPSGENSRSTPVPLGPPLFHLRTGYRIHPIRPRRPCHTWATTRPPLSLSFLFLRLFLSQRHRSNSIFLLQFNQAIRNSDQFHCRRRTSARDPELARSSLPFLPYNPFLMFPYFSLHSRSLSLSLSPLLPFVVPTVARRAIRESGKLDKARTGNGIETEPGH